MKPPRLPHTSCYLARFHLQTDVFALGVILLQLATRLPSIVPGAHGAAHRLLYDHVRDLFAKGSRTGPKGDPTCAGTWHSQPDAQAADGGRPSDDPSSVLEGAASSDPGASEAAIVSGLISLGVRCTEQSRHMRPSVEEVQLALADLRSADGGPSSFYAFPERLRLTGGAAAAPFHIASGGGPGSPGTAPGGLRLQCTCCCEAERDTVFLPCGHSVVCRSCAGALVGVGAEAVGPGARAPGGGGGGGARRGRLVNDLAAGPGWDGGFSKREFLCPLCRVGVLEWTGSDTKLLF